MARRLPGYNIATPRLPLELVLRNLISDWAVKPRTDDWEAILNDSVKDFEAHRRNY